MTDPSPLTAPIDRVALTAAIASISVAGVGFGHSLPLFSILLERYGASDTVIGLNTGTAAASALLATPFFPRVINRVGVKAFLTGCLLLMILSYGLFALAGDSIALWFPLRFLYGIAGAGLFAGSEIWINTLAPVHLRGRIIGIYATCLAIGFAAGPLLIDAVGTVGFTPFFVGMAVFATAIIPVALATAPPPEPPDAERGFFHLLPKAPATFLSAAVFAGAEAAILTFLPVFAIEEGLGEKIGARAITVYGLGLVFLQYAIGRAADRIGHRRSLVICATIAVAGGVGFLVLTDQLTLIFAVLFLWGGFIAGLYTIGLTIIGDSFGGRSLGAANTGFVFMYAFGAILGPVGAGFARSAGGQWGLEVFLLVMLTAYAVLVFARRRAEIP